jgi:hypothetical protein
METPQNHGALLSFGGGGVDKKSSVQLIASSVWGYSEPRAATAARNNIASLGPGKTGRRIQERREMGTAQKIIAGPA